MTGSDRMSCVLGIDIGTTSTIGILVRLPDTVLGIASRPVTLASPHPGWAEENPEQWWDNACAIIRELIAAVYPEIYTGFNERIQQPHGFHLDIPPRRRVWPTPNGKANILVMPGLDVDDPVHDPDMLRLATVRSHDQYNTTIYSYNDRYRGVYNDRMVLFMNIEDRLARGLEKEARVSLETISGDGV